MTTLTAEILNNRLAEGGVVQVTTYAKSTLYQKRNAGCFVEVGHELFVKRGKKLECLGPTKNPGVGIRMGRYADSK